MRNQIPFSYFFDFCEIPHASHDEAAALNWLKEFAETRGLAWRQSHNGSVLISKPGQKQTKSQPLILQAHIDMVYVRTADSTHRYGMPLDVVCEDGVIRASNTSLGADNGIGVAYMLALLDSSSIPHPPLHALFTVCEEDGMVGASTLETNMLPADRLINLDSEVSWTMTVSSAGTKGTLVSIPYEREKRCGDGSVWDIEICGLTGGHSGFQIINGSANAIFLLRELLRFVLHSSGGAVISLKGGTKRNAIPTEASARIRIPCGMELKLQESLGVFARMSSERWQLTDPRLAINLKPAADDRASITNETLSKLLSAIDSLPNGVLSMHPIYPDMIMTSTNVGVLCDLEDVFTLESSMRSADKKDLEKLVQEIEAISIRYNGTCKLIADCPPWEYAEKSPLRELCNRVCQEFYGKPVKMEIVHAGLECGCFSRLKPELDMVSIGPDIFNVHTPQEHIRVADILDTWEYLCKVLAQAQNCQ